MNAQTRLTLLKVASYLSDDIKNEKDQGLSPNVFINRNDPISPMNYARFFDVHDKEEDTLNVITGDQLIQVLAYEDEVTVKDVHRAHPEIFNSYVYPENAYTTAEYTQPLTKPKLLDRFRKALAPSAKERLS